MISNDGLLSMVWQDAPRGKSQTSKARTHPELIRPTGKAPSPDGRTILNAPILVFLPRELVFQGSERFSDCRLPSGVQLVDPGGDDWIIDEIVAYRNEDLLQARLFLGVETVMAVGNRNLILEWVGDPNEGLEILARPILPQDFPDLLIIDWACGEAFVYVHQDGILLGVCECFHNRNKHGGLDFTPQTLRSRTHGSVRPYLIG